MESKIKFVFIFILLPFIFSCTSRKCCPDLFTWSRGKISPTRHEFENALSDNHKIYTLGGPNHGAFEVFDTKTKTWSVLPPLPQPVYFFGCVILNHTIYVMGGIDTLKNFSNTFQKFDLLQNKWDTLPSLSIPRINASAVVCNDKIFLVGGAEGKNYQNSRHSGLVEAYDPLTQSWQKKSDLPTPRYGLATICINNKILAAGGSIVNAHYSAENTSIVELYNPLTDTWSRMADLPSPNFLFGLFEIDSKIYSIGGYGYREFSPVIRYDMNADQWMQVGNMPEIMNQFGIAVDGMKVYVIGGKTNGKSMWVGKKLK